MNFELYPLPSPAIAIPLTQGLIATVSIEDFPRAIRHNWHAARTAKRFEARRRVADPSSRWRQKIQRLHHFIYGQEVRIDHKDGNALNNQRENLRPATRIQNGQNRGTWKHSTRFKGVSIQHGKFKSHIRVNRELKHLGYFDSAEEAAKVYDAAALKYFGAFAKTNQQLGLFRAVE